MEPATTVTGACSLGRPRASIHAVTARLLLRPMHVAFRGVSAAPAARHGPAPGLLASAGLPAPEVFGIGAVVLVVAVAIAAGFGRRAGRRALAQRLTALGSRLGIDSPDDSTSIETSLAYLEQVTGAAAEAVADSSSDAIRLRRALDTFQQGVVLCDESGTVVYRNARANALMTSRHGEALAAQAVTELLEDAWDNGSAERTLDLYGPPRRTLTVRARQIDDGRRPLGVVAIIEDVSERRRLEEIRRDFVANVSHELKTPMGALGLLAETLVAEPDVEVGRRLANRIHAEAFRVSRIIDDLLDLSRIESEEAPPREPVLVNLVMAEAAERVRASAEQGRIGITLTETDPPVAVLGDRRQLVSAMHALIENAVTYSYEGSTVAVAARVVRAGSEPPQQSGSPSAAVIGAPPPPRESPPPAAMASSSGPAALGHLPHSEGRSAGSPEAGAPGAPNGPAVPAEGVLPAENSGVTRRLRRGEDMPSVHLTGHSNWPGTARARVAGDLGPEERADSASAAAPTPAPSATSSAVARSTSPSAGTGPADGATVGDGGAGPAAARPTPAADVTAPASAASATPEGGSATTEGGTATANGARPQEPTTRRWPRDTVRISVTDHGIGIPARDLDRIFERFYRVDQGRSRHTGGTGLGLSIVRHVASNHQGWVEVESREGEGSTFTLVLPLHPDRS